jgi:hypothetical protein
MPLLRARCASVTQLTIYHYVRGFVLSNEGVFTYANAASVTREVPLSVFSLVSDWLISLTIPPGLRGQRYSVAAHRERVTRNRATERELEFARQGELQAAAAAGQHPILVDGKEYFLNSTDPKAVCGPSVDVTMMARDKAVWSPPQLTARRLREHSTDIQILFCERGTRRTRINFTMMVGGEVVRRVTMDGDFIVSEVFMDPALMRNPSGEALQTSELFHAAFLDHLFFGRFEHLRHEDPGRAHFSWLYTEFVELYGSQYREHLTPPLVTIEITRTRGGVREGSSRYTMEERVSESWRKERDNAAGIFGVDRYRTDITAILTRHAPPSKALAQLYENFYRYATNQPPVQDRP